MIQEEFKDIEIQYLFIKKFKWTDPFHAEKFQGHPREGQVYRCIYNDLTKNRKLLIGKRDAILIDDFKSSADYDGEMINLDKKNIIQSNLPESELDKIITWMDSDDIKEMYQPKQISLPLQELAKEMNRQEQEEHDFLQNVVDAFSNLMITNSVVANIMLELAECANHQIVIDHDDPDNLLTLHPDHSTGVNITRALECINRYISPNRRVNLDPDDLVVAILSLVTELESGIINERE